MSGAIFRNYAVSSEQGSFLHVFLQSNQHLIFLLSSRLYCRFWNSTKSAAGKLIAEEFSYLCLLFSDTGRGLSPPVGNDELSLWSIVSPDPEEFSHDLILMLLLQISYYGRRTLSRIFAASSRREILGSRGMDAVASGPSGWMPYIHFISEIWLEAQAENRTLPAPFPVAPAPFCFVRHGA